MMQEMAQASRYEPPPRYFHAAVSIGNKLHLWGGYAGSIEGTKELADVVELFDILTEIWEKKTSIGIPPPGLRLAAHTVIGTSLYNFGGWHGTSRYNSLHQLNTVSWEWKELVARNPSSAPMKKSGSGMVALDEKRLLVFAGHTGSDWTNELHIYNIPEGMHCQPLVFD